MTEPSAPQGFSDGQSFQYDGKLDSVPDWVDKGWATYDRGPALAVPRGDPNKGPYATTVARIGDFVYVNKKGNRYAVLRAEELGEQPGSPTQLPTEEKPLPAKPVGTEHASLEDLDQLGILPFDQMNEEQQAQMIARGTAPPEAMEEAGLGPSGLAGSSYPGGSTVRGDDQPQPSRRRRKADED